MSTGSTRVRIVAGGVALLMLGGIVSASARATPLPLIEMLLGRYIVTLRDSVADPGAVARRQTGLLGGTLDRVFNSALKGYSGSLPSALISSLLGDPLVKTVELDSSVALNATELNPPAGLDRIDQRALPLSRSYTYTTGGAGVTAYVLDTGVARGHPEFVGRVTTGFNVLDGSTDTSDCLGHGTHVAGTLASSTYGVAKGVTIVPVKAFGCSDTTPLSALIAAVDWATSDHKPGRPAVANFSFSGAASDALDRAVAALSNDGVAVAVAAGNDSLDACASSPARVPQVLTVAAIDQSDAMAAFSNGGPCVDLFAPGVRILSTDSRSRGAVALSGTSMSSPMVAGALALEMSVRGTTAQQAQNRVLARATTGAVKGTGPLCALLSGCRPATPANRLLFTG